VPTGQNSAVTTTASQLPVAAASASRNNANLTPSQPQQSAIGVPPIRFNLTNSRLALENQIICSWTQQFTEEQNFSIHHDKIKNSHKLYNII
jgi:hypothetical protein